MDADNNISRRAWLGRVLAGIAGTGAVAATVSCRRDDSGMSAPTEGMISCTGCGRCMPCGYGVDIPAIFAFYNRAVVEGVVPADGDVNKMSRDNRHRFMRDYDREINHRHAALRCISCWHCVGGCAGKVKIPRELGRIAALVDRVRDLNLYD